MTLMKDAPLPTFGKTIAAIALDSLTSVSARFCSHPAETKQSVCKSFIPMGDHFIGARIFGESFQGLLFLSATHQFFSSAAKEGGHGSDGAPLKQVFEQALEIFKERFTGQKLSLGQSNGKADFTETTQFPEEWLMSVVTSELGLCSLAFGYTGNLGFSEEDEPMAQTDAKHLTFF